YAGKDGKIGTPDDIQGVNDLHLPVNEDVVIQLKSMDVLHSFFLPHVRVKHDAVPGMKQFVWFKANKAGVFDIVCAELCGWGHYKMRGKMTLESRDQFDTWLAKQYADQERAGYKPTQEAAE
ncbi:MAG: cytochrome c oxidase subunit II, partial [Planctomycetota bacterium]